MGLMTFLVYIVILVIVMIFLWWLLTQVTLPAPLDRIATIVLVAIGVLVLIYILLQFAGGSIAGIHIPR